MRILAGVILAAALGAAPAPNTLTAREVQEGWLLLFDGESLFGWRPQGNARWKVESGSLTAEEGGQGWLRSASQFADFILRADFRTSAKGNSGIFLRSATEGEPHVTGYELQIWNENPKFPTGSLVNHHATKKGRLKGDAWNTYEVTVQGDRWVIKLNGKTVLEARDAKSLIGHIGLQSNKDRIEFRNLKLKPLGLQPIFNGKDLTGWRKVESPRAKEPPAWSVRDGALHVEKGPGQLETEATWRDLILQLAIRANSSDPNRHPNSGIFLRGDPNGYWSGYESQIRNEFSEGDPTKPVDFGTGGIYRYQPARRIVARDNEYFHKTIVMRGRHFGVWINGYPVTDWEDPNPEGASVRNKQARLAAGTISLQAHDPTTNLDFRDIRLAPLP